jgi:multiple sugar transport system permease protein
MVGFLLIAAIPFALSFDNQLYLLERNQGLESLLARVSGRKLYRFENYAKILKSKEFGYRSCTWGNTWCSIYPLMLVSSLGIAVFAQQTQKRHPRFTGFCSTFRFRRAGLRGAPIIWKWVLDPQYGILNDISGADRHHRPAWLQDPKWAMFGIVLASVWKDMGFTA